MFDFFINCSSNPHHVCRDDHSPTKGLYGRCQSDDFDLPSRSQVRLKLQYFLTCHLCDNIEAITFKLGMLLDVWMPFSPILVSMTLTLMQGHSGSVKAKKSALHALSN